ncbi:slow as molasses [Musca autumnalis]|uniref:slow as molasses n=1 Tax=Musca autumnalis TaxID=221902 RepID=UPI003CF8E9B1
MVLKTQIENCEVLDESAATTSNQTNHLVVNTTDFNDRDFNDFVNISEEIERNNRQRRSQRRSGRHHTMVVATMTREELFECTNIDDDQFLNALEHQNEFDASMNKTVLLRSIDNLMKYFDEDVQVPDSSGKSTPVKLKTKGKVASAVASFRSKAQKSPSPLMKRKNKQQREAMVVKRGDGNSSNVGELKKRYEMSPGKVDMEQDKENISPKKTLTLSPKMLKKSKVKQMALMLSPEAVAKASNSPIKSATLSPKMLRKNKVKQMALLFNNKMHSIMRKSPSSTSTTEQQQEAAAAAEVPEGPEAQEEEPLTPTEPISPGLSSIASPNFTSTLVKPKSPKLKPKMPTFIAKLPSPRASPLFKRRQLSKTNSISSLSLSGSPSKKQQSLQKQPSTTCLVAENVFQQLSVKDKALLYNKFIEDMSKKNPKFSKHGQILENNVKKEMSRGEVVCEKQGTVKHLRESLEAKLTPTKTNTLSKTLQRFKKSPGNTSLLASPSPSKSKSKEFEDIPRPLTPQTPTNSTTIINEDESEDPLHVSTLTVVLKPSPEAKKYATKPRNQRKKRDVRFLTDLGNVEPQSFKRTQEMIRSSVNVEPFAPPKKIRRTQHERLAPKMFFQNQHLEKLFYNWLKEKNGVVFDITPVHNKQDVIEIVPKNSRDNVIPKDKVDQLLEEAINKLEAEKEMQQTANKELSAINIIKETLEEKSSFDASVIEVELPVEVDQQEETKEPEAAEQQLQEQQQLSNSQESLDNDSDLGVTSINKTTSEDSNTEKDSLDIPLDMLAKTSKPMRKKKLRRSLTWKKDYSLVEANPISTDSDSDCRSLNNKSLSGTLSKSKKCTAYVKKLLFKTINSSVSSEQASTVGHQELSILELDRSLMRQVNSPSKIKDAYTLTVMSSPSPPTESECGDSDLPRSPCKDMSRSWPSLLEANLDDDDLGKKQLKHKSVSTEFTDLEKNKLELEQDRLMMDSFIDQGFETGSNEMESPIRLPRKSLSNSELDKLPTVLLRVSEENPKNFSTPNKDKPIQQNFTAAAANHQQLHQQQKNIISPIPVVQNPHHHHKHHTMQVIKEDCSLEDSQELEYSNNSSGYHMNGSYFNGEATYNSHATCSSSASSHASSSTSSSHPSLGVTHKVETSQFWISFGDFTTAMNIHFYESERLMLLSNIFAQKCAENRDMTFGIDDQKFSPECPLSQAEILRKIPQMENCSQYWFSTGDVLLPFAGKHLTTHKIQAFFTYIREFMDDMQASLRFGIDGYEFSNFSISPTTTDATYTWPSVSSPIKTSDLDQSDFESVELEQSISFSALGSNQSDTGSIKSEESPDTLEQIFEDARNLNLSKTQTDKLAMASQLTVPEMLKTLHNQQEKLKSLEEKMLHCAPPSLNSSSSSNKNLEQFRECPEYMRKLRSIISAIDNIGRGNNGFNACSIEQLESFMFFLSRYADLCLANCTAHIEKILDVVMNQRSFQA